MFCQGQSRSVISNNTVLNPNSQGTCSSAGRLFSGMLSPDFSPAALMPIALIYSPQSCVYCSTGSCGAQLLRPPHEHCCIDILLVLGEGCYTFRFLPAWSEAKVLPIYQSDTSQQSWLPCMHRSGIGCRGHKKEKPHTHNQVRICIFLCKCTLMPSSPEQIDLQHQMPIIALQTDPSLLRGQLQAFYIIPIYRGRN